MMRTALRTPVNMNEYEVQRHRCRQTFASTDRLTATAAKTGVQYRHHNLPGLRRCYEGDRLYRRPRRDPENTRPSAAEH